MKVGSLLETKKNKRIITIDGGKSVEDAIRLMHEEKISGVLVTESGKTVGIFTERDVVRSYISKDGKKFKDIPLRDVMTATLISAGREDNVGDVMGLMVRNNIRHMPVMENGNVLGMLSIRDVIGL
ncbi:MAG: CBS domain-containing protein [Nitrospirota bacterium]